MGIKKIIFLFGFFFTSLPISCTLCAANGEPQSRPKFRWQDLLPRAYQSAPQLNVNIVTEVTPEGKALPSVSVDHPVYYVGMDGGYMEKGDPEAGGHLPNAKLLAKTLQGALVRAGYLAADRDHPPSIFIFYSWGSFNKYTALSPNDPTLWQNLVSRVALVGGKKFADDFTTAVELGSLASFRADRLNDSLLNEAFGDLYFLVASAYELDAAKKGERKLFWRTKVSTDSLGVAMDETLPFLVSNSAQYFGHEMSGPVQLISRLKDGKVELGPTRLIEYVDPSKPKSEPKR